MRKSYCTRHRYWRAALVYPVYLFPRGRVFFCAASSKMFTAYVYLLVLVLAWSNLGLTLQESSDEGDCIRKRKSMAIEWPNCEPTYTKVPSCSGTCRSFDVVIPTAPYFEKQCNCCKSARHSVKKRQLQFNCHEKMENHTVFIPIIDQCGCVQCDVL